MNYLEAREYLEQVNIYGSVLGLDTIVHLLDRLDNPQNSLNVIHIAGTNGKGSTAAFIENILMCAGYSVGRYSSPAVFNYREIIRFNGNCISEEQVTYYINKIKAACDSMVAEGMAHPTPFEIETAMAFLYLKDMSPDVAIIECGMGGATDATNVFEKVICSVITSISLDHVSFLGSTVEDIAKVKAGIIKKGCPVITAPQKKEVLDVIKETARSAMSKLVVVKAPIDAEGRYISVDGTHYCLKPGIKGIFQNINGATAVEVALEMEKQGYKLTDSIAKGLKTAKWEGRLETICTNPLVVIDGAHNPDAVKLLKESIDLYFTNKRITFIMGVLADKDFSKEAEIICPIATNIITVTPNNIRALDAKKLADTIKRYNPNVTASNTIENAVNQAFKQTELGNTDMILAFGTLSHLADIKKIVMKKTNS